MKRDKGEGSCNTCGHADLDQRNPSMMGFCREGGRKEFTYAWWRCDRWIARTCNNCRADTIDACARCMAQKHGPQSEWVWNNGGDA